MVDGDPGIGKSTIALDFAARVSVGAPWPDGEPCKPGNVLVMTAEEALAETVLPRLLLAGGDPQRVFVLDHVLTADGIPRLPSLPADLPQLQQILIQRRVRLVIIDVLASYLGGDVNSHQDTDVRRALFPLFRMAQATSAAILMLRHLNKGDSKNSLYRGGGSIGIIGQARAAFLVAEDPESYDGRRLFAGTKQSLAPMPPTLAYSLLSDEVSGCAAVKWHGEDPHTASELLSAPLDPEEAEEQDHIVLWLQDYLFHCGGTSSGGQVIGAAVKAGYARATVQRARKRAGVSFGRGGWQGGTVWVLDPVTMTALQAASADAKPVKAAPVFGQCGGCERDVMLRRDGLLRLHRTGPGGTACDGSAQPPIVHPPHLPQPEKGEAHEADGTKPGSTEPETLERKAS